MILDGLDPEQRLAVEHSGSHLLVVAGPGSGKTKTLTTRIAHMVHTGIDPSRILAVTFTNKAAAEMRTRVASLVPSADGLWVCTFHSFAARLLRIEHEAAGLPRSFTIADASDSQRYLEQAVRRAGIDDVKKAAREARKTISGAKTRGMSLTGVTSPRVPNLPEIARDYQAALTAAGAVDFDDLLVLAGRVLTAGDDVATKWGHRFDAVLADEYQDSAHQQVQMLTALTAGGAYLTAVGDADQSIYRFRAADPTVVTDFDDMWPDATTIHLRSNYRSTPQIVAVSNAVISPNESTARAEQVAAALNESAGTPVVLRGCVDGRSEARHVADLIAASDLPPDDHAVLLRTNASTQPFEEAFRARGVPYRVVGGQSFFSRAEIKDCLAWLRAAVAPTDKVAFERASTAPRSGIGPAGLQLVGSLAAEHNIDLHAAAQTASEHTGRHTQQTQRLAGFAHQLRELRAVLAADGPSAGVTWVLNHGLREHWKKGDGAAERLENLDQLVSAAAEFETSGATVDGSPAHQLPAGQQVTAWLAHTSLDPGDSDDGTGVSIITIHAAKGKEWPSVFVPALEERLLPHQLSATPEEIEEERRLFFVAVSRAERHLHLSYAATRFQHGKETDQMPSRFLKDLPSSVQRVHAAGRPDRRAAHGSARRHHTPAAAAGFESDARRRRREARERNRDEREQGRRINPKNITPGTRVSHDVFGEGTVVTVRGLWVDVRFDNETTTRTLDARSTPMRTL